MYFKRKRQCFIQLKSNSSTTSTPQGSRRSLFTDDTPQKTVPSATKVQPVSTTRRKLRKEDIEVQVDTL